MSHELSRARSEPHLVPALVPAHCSCTRPPCSPASPTELVWFLLVLKHTALGFENTH